MSENTKIQWCHHTGGPWLICTEVSPGCAHCYARELMQNRLFHMARKAYKAAGFEDWETRPVWGKTAPRVLSKGFWKDAYRLNKQAGKEGTRFRMFPSLIDWLDEMPAGIIDQDGNWLDKDKVLADFLKVIHSCQNLDWLLLTKRPENWRPRLEAVMESEADGTKEGMLTAVMISAWLGTNGLKQEAPENVWIGVSAEDQQRWDERVRAMAEIPAKVRFVSAEPLLGPINGTEALNGWPVQTSSRQHVTMEMARDAGDIALAGTPYSDDAWDQTAPGPNWVIIGGESGPESRGCNVGWVRDLVQQCKSANVATFVKQLGAHPFEQADYTPSDSKERERVTRFLHLADAKGGDMSEWSEDLRVREFPVAA